MQFASILPHPTLTQTQPRTYACAQRNQRIKDRGVYHALAFNISISPRFLRKSKEWQKLNLSQIVRLDSNVAYFATAI